MNDSEMNVIALLGIMVYGIIIGLILAMAILRVVS